MAHIFAVARVRRVLLAMGVVFAVLPVASALAATTIGQTEADFYLGCASVSVSGQPEGTVYGDRAYVVPDGAWLITSFSFHSAGGALDFLVLRPASGGGAPYTVVGRTGVEALGTGLESFPASIVVRGGDILGFWFRRNLNNCGFSGPGPSFVRSGVSDPNTNDTIDGTFPADLDLNESAQLVPLLPTSKDQCKKGGWQSFGTTFKNQGDCVSFVATGGKNQPSGS